MTVHLSRSMSPTTDPTETECGQWTELTDVSTDADDVTCPDCIETYLDFQLMADELVEAVEVVRGRWTS